MTDSLKCPKCDDGHAGADHFGEAMDCHYCGGSGSITAEMYCDLWDKCQSMIGDLMHRDELLRQSGVAFNEQGEPDVDFRSDVSGD